MEITNIVLNIFSIKGFVGLMEFMIILMEIIYVLYAFILTRQIRLMNKSFNTPTQPLFSFLAHIHFLASIILVIFSIILA